MSQPGRLARVTRVTSGRVASALPLGFVATYLGVVVVLPLAALIASSTHGGWSGFWDTVTTPEAVAALKLTLGLAAVAALINAVLGTITAWVLVRDDFRGKSLVNSVIDLPFALPTIVAGLLLLDVLRPAVAGRRPPRLHADGDPLRAALRDAPVRRADGAAGADRARHRDGGGGSLARRERVHHLPPDRPAEHPPRHPLRA